MKLRLLLFSIILENCPHFGMARCPFPGIPASATTWKGSGEVTWANRRAFNEGEAVEFKCQPSWAMAVNQMSKIQCRNDGTWSGPIPRCDQLSDWNNWEVYASNNGNWTRLKQNETCSTVASQTWLLRTQKTFDRNVSQVQIDLCPGQNWTNDINVHLANVECDPVKPLIFNCENASRSAEAKFFTIFSSETAISLSSVSLLVNEGDHCGWPPIPVDGDVDSTAFTPGHKQVDFKCKNALQFASPGPWSVKCNPQSGQWTDLPKCSCPKPSLPPYVKQSGGNDTSISYQCNAHLVGNGTLVCDLSTGVWTRPACTCRGQANEFSNMSTISRKGDSFEYKCKSPLVGSGSITCNMDTGLWSQPVCTCRLPEVPYAIIADKSVSSISYRCPAHLELTGTDTIVCNLTTGQWKPRAVDADFPQCRCRDNSLAKNANHVPDCLNKSTSLGSRVTCDLSSGNWIVPSECKCPNPFVPFAQLERLKADEATFKCLENFQLIGNGTVRCNLETGKWTTLPECTCKFNVPNAHLYLENGSVRYKCNERFEMIDSTTTSCILKPDRQIELPKCRCRAPSPPWKAVVLKRTDTSIEYRCSDGFELIGNNITTCDTNGQWSELPECWCIAPATPSNALIVSRTDASIEYKCQDELTLTGKAHIICNSKGTWSTLPTCQQTATICLQTSTVSLVLIFMATAMLIMLVMIIAMAKRRDQKHTDDQVVNGELGGNYETVIWPANTEAIYEELILKGLPSTTDRPEESIYIEMLPLRESEILRHLPEVAGCK